MEERRPSKLVGVVIVELELIDDHVGIGPNPLAVAAGEAVVTVQRGHQLEHLLAVGDLVALVEAEQTHFFDATFELFGRAGSERGVKPGGCFVGEDEIHFEQSNEWEAPTSDPLDGEHHRRGNDQYDNPPRDDVQADLARREVVRCEPGNQERPGNGQQQDGKANGARESRTAGPSGPSSGAVIILNWAIGCHLAVIGTPKNGLDRRKWPLPEHFVALGLRS